MTTTSASAITRVVRLHLQPNCAEAFSKIFHEHQNQIASFEGCILLNGYRAVDDANVFYTISNWQSVAHLDQYRFSNFFRELWKQVKPMLAEKTIAHSLQVL